MLPWMVRAVHSIILRSWRRPAVQRYLISYAALSVNRRVPSVSSDAWGPAARQPLKGGCAVAYGDGLTATLDRLSVAWPWLGMRLKPLQGMSSLATQPWRQKSRLRLWLVTQM